MFFAFQIFILFVLTFDQANSRIVKDKIKTKEFIISTSTSKSWKIKDDAPENATSFTTHKPLFQIIKNLTRTKSPNLKSNVFDKMLSDEMLSIKQHFYEQDKKTSTIPMVAQSNAPTPTLEIKQRWPIIEATQHLRNENESKHNDKLNNSDHLNQDKKVLELRSLPELTPHYAHPLYLYHGNKMCTCKNLDLSVTCGKHGSTECTKTNTGFYTKSSHICTQPGSHPYATGKSYLCTQCSSKCTHKECSRANTLYSTAFYVTYQPFFIGVTQPSNMLYYHPDVVNELKIPKKKGKTRKYYTDYTSDNLYYNNEKGIKDDNNYEDESIEGNDEDFMEYDKPFKGSTSKKPPMIEVVIKEDKIKENSAEKYAPKPKDDKDFSNEKTINDIVNDLKLYYKDSVIKDCYCSFMPSTGCLKLFKLHYLIISLLIIL